MPTPLRWTPTFPLRTRSFWPSQRLSLIHILPQEAAVLLDIGFAFHPLGEALTPPEASDLLSMSEEKLNALYQEAEGNLNGLAGRFYSLMLG